MDAGLRVTTRVVHCKRESFDVYVGRPTKWGNPFKLERGATDAERERVLELYRAWLYAPERAVLRTLARRELRGKVLSCWCAPKRCHGDVLAFVAESENDAELGIK